MSRKKRDAFRCTGAAFCEIRSLLRSAIGISVFGVLDVAVPLGVAFQGVASKLCFRDTSQLKCRFWTLGVQTCGVVQILLKLTCDDIVTFRGRRRTSCGF